MSDCPVEKLHYRVIAESTVSYDEAAPLYEETEHFKMSLDSQQATFEMKALYPQSKARAIVEHYLNCWSVLMGLEQQPEQLRVEFVSADTRVPEPATEADAVTPLVHKKFPPLPKNFALSPDVETMYLRYKAYQQQQESLTSMAYICLAVFELSAGGRRQAARRYRVSKSVLKTLSVLCTPISERVDVIKKHVEFIPLSPQEKKWMVVTIKKLIKRVGEWTANPEGYFEKITLENLPKL